MASHPFNNLISYIFQSEQKQKVKLIDIGLSEFLGYWTVSSFSDQILD